MPTSQRAPWPYDVEIGGVGYLRPPQTAMQAARIAFETWYHRASLPWFPERQQQGSLSERLFPSMSEAALTIRDRSGGFGWSDLTDEQEGQETNTYAYTDAVDSGASGDGQGVDCSVPNMVLLGPRLHAVTMTGGNGVLSGHFELSPGGTRTLFVVFGTKMFKTTDGTTFSAVQANGSDLPAALTDRPIVFQGAQSAAHAYFPMGTSQAMASWSGNTVNGFGTTKATSTNGYATNNKVVSLAVADDRVYGLALDTTAATQAWRVNEFFDGFADNAANRDPAWLPSIAVSDRSDSGQYLIVNNDTVYIGCNQTLRTLDASREALESVLWSTQPNANNFRWWTSWQQELWFSANQGTYRIVPRGGAPTFEQCGPEMLPNNRTPVRGTITAMVGDDYCLYAFLKTEAGVTYLLKYRYYDGGKRAAFHSILRIGTYTVSYAFISTVQGTNPILYFDTGTTTLQYILLPRNGFYPQSDSNYEYCASGYLFDTRQYGGLYFVTKALIAYTGRAEGLTSTETVTAYYRSGASDSFTAYGDALSSDPGSRVALTSPVSVTWWEPRLKLVRGSTVTNTPRLLSSTYSFAVRPVAKGHFTIYIWVTDYGRARNNLHDARSAYQIESTLINLDSSASLTTIRNKRGLSYDVFIDTVDIFETEDEADRTPVTIAKITASEFAARGAGTNNALDGYLHQQLDQFTHDQLLNIL